MQIGSGIPAQYDYINLANAAQSPSTVHCRNTNLSFYFRRYLLQKAMSLFKWEIPEHWSKDYFLYVLYCWGYLAVVNTDSKAVSSAMLEKGKSGKEIGEAIRVARIDAIRNVLKERP